MAVFTDITQPNYSQQLSAIQDAFGLTITQIDGMLPGSSDSKFKLVVEESRRPLVLTIHEPPSVSPMGRTTREIIEILRFADHLSKAISATRDTRGMVVNANILKSMRMHSITGSSEPFFELVFDAESKVVSIVPFLEGRFFDNSPEELPSVEDSELAGRALAAFLLAGRTYPRQDHFIDYNFPHFVREADRLSETELIFERLGGLLSEKNLGRLEAIEAGQNYLGEMSRFGHALLPLWEQLHDRQALFPRSIIHGDLYTDNTMIDTDGRFYIFDLNEVSCGSIGIDIGIALNSWASQNGQPLLNNIRRFLQAFDTVIPLSAEMLSAVPTFAQFGAFRWELFRIQRLELQDPKKYHMRSPIELRSLRHAWCEYQDQFKAASSVHDL